MGIKFPTPWKTLIINSLLPGTAKVSNARSMPGWEANLADTLHITTHHYPSLHITHYFMTTMKQFANDSDETENLSDDEILGKPITPTEIHEHVSKLKTKKASSMNSLLDEMIKHGRYFLRPSLEKIFNDIT